MKLVAADGRTWNIAVFVNASQIECNFSHDIKILLNIHQKNRDNRRFLWYDRIVYLYE